MVKTSHRAVVFAAAACVCMLAGCGDAPTEAQSSVPTADKKVPLPKVADLETDMVAAVSAGKGFTSVGVHFALRAPPKVNTPLPVDVAIVPHRKFTMIRARFEGRDGLATAAGDDFGPRSDVASEVTLTHQIVLLPSKEGIALVTVSVETEGDDGNVVRTYSIPVIVAGAETAADSPPPAAVSADAPKTN